MPDGPDKPTPQPGTQSGSQIIERKLATILSADVAEFSRLMNEDEEQTLRAFRGHKKIFESLVLMHHGRVFNTAGDAILAEFASAVEAVRCATDVQSALRTCNDQLPLNRQVRFRIGINLGDVMIQGQDLLGDGVNVAARLQTAAEPGGICISGSVHDQIRNKLSLAFHSLGERSYKNIPQPVRTFSIVEAEGGVALPSPKPPSAWKNPVIWVVAGVLIVAGIGYAAYAIHARSEKTAAPVTAVNPPPPPAPAPQPSPANSSAANPATALPPPTPAATSPAPKAAAPAGEEKAVAKSNEPSTPSPAPAPAKPPRATAHAGRFDGAYSGQVCYGKTQNLPKFCYDAQGEVVGNKLTGQWEMRGTHGITMHIEGDVQPSGDVNIFMHSEDPSGSRVATINMVGMIDKGTLIAAGAFERGRPANLSWRLTRGYSPAQPVEPSQDFAGAWELVSSTMNGATQPVKPTRITITQNGSLVRVGGQELRLTDEGTLTYQEFYAHDEQHGHKVEAQNQADLIDTLTWRIKGSMLVFETVFDYRAPYYGHPAGKVVRVMEYRRVTP